MVAPREGKGQRCEAIRHASEARDYFATLVKVRSDGIAASVREQVISGVLLGVAAIAFGTLAIVAVLTVARGVTGTFIHIFEGRTWLGDLVGGVALIAILISAIGSYLTISSRIRLKRLTRKYEQIRTHHRAEHGRHSSDATSPQE
jgi:hypothetical protein